MITFPLKFILVLLGTFFIGVILTPLVRLLAFKIGAVDYPNARRINKKPMPGDCSGFFYLYSALDAADYCCRFFWTDLF